ncbi:MAG: orotidine-5'-phosphate decarboxylase [Rhodospirillaceae bacterium]|nr:orotidine-5'-phosphate decarboxylase [Rhodospirillaceae bacterium]|tara:strand:- start:1711 stop:2397 length:687 start_codon:yes stop_codon:yes gene_type:complete
MAGVRERLEKIIIDKNTRLCFSADLVDPREMLIMLEKVASHIAVVKMHYDILKFDEKVMRVWQFIESLKLLKERHNFMIMEDRKFFDISYIVEKQFAFFRGWVDLVTVHGLVNDSVIKSIDAGVLLVSQMSNNTYDITGKCIELFNNNANVVGFITQQKIDYGNVMSFTPGISFESKQVGDQKYRNISDISGQEMPDIVIVGRAIYEAPDIVAVVERMNKSINGELPV